MLRKKISAGVAVLIAAQLIAVACYVTSSRTCHARANRGIATCTLYSGPSYSWVAIGSGSGAKTSAKSDDSPHCEYQCSASTFFWAFPGAVTTGGSCE